MIQTVRVKRINYKHNRHYLKRSKENNDSISPAYMNEAVWVLVVAVAQDFSTIMYLGRID